MRKWNGILTACILALFLAHGIMGAYQLFGAGDTALKTIARAAVFLTGIHAVIGLRYTIDALRIMKKTGTVYARENFLFWARRISGFVLLVLLSLHMTSFSARNAGSYRLQWFDTGKLILHILLAADLALHILSNIKPMMITFGIRGLRKRAADILFVLSVVLLFMTAAFVIYYIRWNRLG